MYHIIFLVIQVLIIGDIIFLGTVADSETTTGLCNASAFKTKCVDEELREMGNDGTITRSTRMKFVFDGNREECEPYPYGVQPIHYPLDGQAEWHTVLENFESSGISFPYVFELGRYSMKYYIMKTLKEKLVLTPYFCNFTVIHEQPIAKIEGGSEVTLQSDTEVVIDGSASQDLDQKNGDSSNLLFIWSCKVEEGSQENDFCSRGNLAKYSGKGKNKITILSDQASTETSYIITLEVKVELKGNETGEFKSSYSQTLRFSSDITEIEILCAKNCPPLDKITLKNLPVILKANCIKNCKSVTQDSYEWKFKEMVTSSTSSDNFDYATKSKGRKGNIFYVLPNSLEDSKTYSVILSVTGITRGTAEKEIKTHRPPPLKDCRVIPNKGMALVKRFTTSCTYVETKQTSCEIYAVSDGKDTLLAQGNSINSMGFKLSVGAKVKIVVTDQYGYISSVLIDDIEVDPLLIPNIDVKKTEELVDQLVSIAKTRANKEPEASLQSLNALVDDISKLPPDKREHLLNKIEKESLNLLDKMKINSPTTAKQIGQLAQKIADKHKEKPDPDISASVSELCRKSAEKIEQSVRSSTNPNRMRASLINDINTLSRCSSGSLNNNSESIAEPTVSVQVTTVFPILECNNIPENYPDYTNDEKAVESTAKFEAAAKNFEKICFTNAKMLAMTLAPEEDHLVKQHGPVTIVSARKYGEEMSEKHLAQETVSLKPSDDFTQKKDTVFDVLMCTTDKNPFWWADKTEAATSILFVRFDNPKLTNKRILSRTVHGTTNEDDEDDEELISDFADPFSITFVKKENVTIKFDVHEADLPKKGITEINKHDFYRTVSTYRIYAFHDRGFTISFEQMTNDDRYDVMITDMEKPTYSQFKKHSFEVSMDNSVIDLPDHRQYDRWCYLNLLPNKIMDTSKTDKYYFSVYTTACYTWSPHKKRWVFACRALKGDARLNSITCLCTRGHVFIGRVVNNKINLVENVERTRLELQLSHCWIIFGTTAIIFLIFAVILFFTSFEKRNDILEKVFFVSDVPSLFQYAYIVVVKTGKKKNSGTTSNVTIKLIGSKASSLEHVLNYPDPELVMMQQRKETWFVIATEKFLGDLLNLEIWFDSIGNHSKWYCSNIEVYDIQQNKSWLFPIDNWFDVIKENHTYFSVASTDPLKDETIDEEKKKTRVNILNTVKSIYGKLSEEVHLWNLGVRDALLMKKERLTVVYSIIVTMSMVIMFIYNVPKFDPSDSIDKNDFGLDKEMAWTPIVGSLVSYFIHFPLLFFIKISKIQKTTKVEKRKLIGKICWGVLLSISIICSQILIIFGFWIPFDTSLLWLVSLILGIFFYALVLQNTTTLLYIYVIKLQILVESFAETTERLIQFVELQRTWIYKRFGSLSLRPYFRHLYFALDEITKKDRIKWEEIKKKILEILEDLVMIAIYVTLLYTVLLLDKEPIAVYNHQEIDSLVSGKHINHPMKIETTDNIVSYVEETLIPSIQALEWYGRFVEEDPGMTKDFSNKYLGIMRIRQHRTIEEKCVVPKIMEFLNMTCRPDFKARKDFRDFYKKWGEIPKFLNNTQERMGKIWKYSSSKYAGTKGHFGDLALYPGGGYIATLGRTVKNSLINMKYIADYKWMDLNTRAVFIEFLTYNPNCNLFNTVQAVFEISASGYILSRIEVQTRKLLMVENQTLLTQKVVYLLYFFILNILVLRILYKIITKRKNFFKDYWSLFDISIVVLSGTTIYLYFMRTKQIQNYIEDLSGSKKNKFVNYFHLFVADNTFTALSAFLVFIATFRLWKLLRFMVIIKVTEKTLKDSFQPLLVGLVYQSVYMTAFIITGVLLFGPHTEIFQNFTSALMTLIRLSVSLYPDFDVQPLTKQPLGYIYFTLFMLFSLFFTTVYIAIITLYYADAKDFYSNDKGFVPKYLKEKLTYYSTLLKIRVKRLRGGEEKTDAADDLIIKPNEGERYEQCLAIPSSRMHAMALISMCVLGNIEGRKRMTSDDFDLMSTMIRNLFANESDEKDLFFISGGSQVRLVDDRKLGQIANICERLVRDTMYEPSRGFRKAVKPAIEDRISRMDTITENLNVIKAILQNIKISER